MGMRRKQPPSIRDMLKHYQKNHNKPNFEFPSAFLESISDHDIKRLKDTDFAKKLAEAKIPRTTPKSSGRPKPPPPTTARPPKGTKAPPPLPRAFFEKRGSLKAPVTTKPMVTGVERIGEPPLPPRGDKRHFFRGSVLGHRFYVGDKPGGMEPGALTIPINKDLIDLLKIAKVINEEKATLFLSINPSDQECAHFLRAEINSLHRHLNEEELKISRQESELPTLAKMLKSQNVDTATMEKIAVLDQVVQELRQKAMKGDYDLSLLKQYYNDTSISPPLDRLQNTNRGQRSSLGALKRWKAWKEFKSSREKENTNALGETFANAVARAYAMPTQQQYILIDTYEDGDLRVMTDCKWQNGLKGMTGCVAGSEYQGYYVKSEKIETADGREIVVPIQTEDQPPYYRSALENEMDAAAQNLALLLIQCDDDCLGSKLQNKMMLDRELYGIDFGHAYRPPANPFSKQNPLVDNISVDFTLDDDTLKTYKNISMLFDSTPTDQMLGLFYTYQSMDDKAIDPETKQPYYSDAERKAIQATIEEYKKYYEKTYPGFAEKMQKIKPNSVNEIYKAYEAKLREQINKYTIEEAKLQESIKKLPPKDRDKAKKQAKKCAERIAELEKNLVKLRGMAELHNKNSAKLLKKFKERMKIPPQQLTLLRNLANLTSVTMETDRSGTVALNHLQIVHNDLRTEWSISSKQVTGKKIIPTSDDKFVEEMVTEERITLRTNARNKGDLEKIINNYLAQFKTDHLNISIRQTKKGIEIEMPKSSLDEFEKLMGEKHIQASKPRIAPDLHILPALITLNEKYPKSANLITNLDLLTSLTNTSTSGNLYILDDQSEKTRTRWKVEENKDQTITFSTAIPKRSIKPEEMLIILQEMMKDSGIEFKVNNKEISFTCTKEQIPKLLEFLDLEKIKQAKQDPKGPLRQLVLRADQTDQVTNEHPSTHVLLRNLEKMTSTSQTVPWHIRKQHYPEKFILQANLTDSSMTQNLVTQLHELKISKDSSDFKLIQKDNRITIECANTQLLSALVKLTDDYVTQKQRAASRREWSSSLRTEVEKSPPPIPSSRPTPREKDPEHKEPSPEGPPTPRGFTRQRR